MKRAFWLLAALGSACNRGASDSVVATGTLEVVEVDVAPMMTGQVSRMFVEDGDSVRTGDTLAILTQPASPADLEQRAARVAAARAGLQDIERGSRLPEIGRGQAEVRALEAEAIKAAADATRAQKLFGAGAISQQQLEVAVTAATQAAARRDASRQSLLLLREGATSQRVAGARAEVAGAQANLSAGQATIAALTLLAPINGVVLSRNAEPGEIVAAGQAAVTLGETNRPWVRVYVDALDLPRIRVGSAVRAVLDGLPDRSFTGRVVAINTKAEFTPRVALTEEERADLTFGVKVEFADSTGMLKPGLPVTITIPKTPPQS